MVLNAAIAYVYSIEYLCYVYILVFLAVDDGFC